MNLDRGEMKRPKLERVEAPESDSGESLRAQEEARQYILDFANRIQSGGAEAFDFAHELPDREPIKADSENRWTQMYRAIFEVTREHPELAQQLGEMEGMISQNPQMLHPAHLIDIASDVMWDPRIHGYLKSNMIHGLGYALRFMESPEYGKALARKLDFTNTEHFSDTAHFLEFMQNLYNIGDDYSYDGDNIVISRVHAALQQAVEKKKGSYLLNVRAQELLAEMDGRSWVSSGFDRMPFMITKDRYARHKEDGLYISAPDEQEHIAQLIGEFNALESQIRPPQHLVDEAVARGETEVWWTPDQNLMRMRSALYEQIDDSFTHRLTYDELVPGNVAGTADESAIEEHDFAYLQRKPIRDTIKNDFEIEIGNLSLQDQYKLLRVLKNVEYGKATPLLLEATRAMWKAGVKDYLDEIRGGSLEVAAGDAINTEDANVVQEVQASRYQRKYPESELQELREGLANALKSPHSRFYLYRKNGEILTFVLFDELSASNDEGRHMGSFMTNPKFEGGALGQALLETALKREIEKGAPLYAICDPSFVPFYEKFGFRLLRSYKDDHGVDTCDIVLEPESLREVA